MKPRNLAAYVEDILTASNRIGMYIGKMSLDDFRKDIKTFDAVVRNIEIIGEAVKRFPESTTSRYPHVAWREAAGMRDVVAHDYPNIVVDIIWDTAKKHVPILEEQMLQIKRDLEGK